MCANDVDNDDDDSVRFCVLAVRSCCFGCKYLYVRKFICYVAAAHFHFSRMRRQYVASRIPTFWHGAAYTVHNTRLYANRSRIIHTVNFHQNSCFVFVSRYVVVGVASFNRLPLASKSLPAYCTYYVG